jgi:hypothetical protein
VALILARSSNSICSAYLFKRAIHRLGMGRENSVGRRGAALSKTLSSAARAMKPQKLKYKSSRGKYGGKEESFVI